MKPVWKRTFDSWVFGDFFDGRGICRYYPTHPLADEHGWFPFAGVEYSNEQSTRQNPVNHGVYVVWFQGRKWSAKLTPKQTELWNQHHDFTPYVPEPTEPLSRLVVDKVRCCEKFKHFSWQFKNYSEYSYCPYCGFKVVRE